MKRLLCLFLCLPLWGCAASQSQREIVTAFQSFLQEIKSGDQEKILQTAPFLAMLSATQRAAAVQSFQRLAAENPGNLHTQVARGSGETWLLRVSISRKGSAAEGAAIVVPFHKNDRGRWEMSSVIEAVQHFDIVPAR